MVNLFQISIIFDFVVWVGVAILLLILFFNKKMRSKINIFPEKYKWIYLIGTIICIIIGIRNLYVGMS